MDIDFLFVGFFFLKGFPLKFALYINYNLLLLFIRQEMYFSGCVDQVHFLLDSSYYALWFFKIP